MLILKQLRKKKNISQSELASIIGVSLRTIQLYEKENANIPIKNLNKIAAYFEMGIDRLYAQEVNEDNLVYDNSNSNERKGHAIRKLGPGKYLLSSPLLIKESQPGYVDNINTVNFLNSLPRISFIVEQVSVGNYMAFEILNSSMDNGEANRIPQNSIVLGKRTSTKELLKHIKKEDTNWILVCSNTIMCKKITQYDKVKKSLTCHSINSSPEYPDFEVLVSDVIEFYKVIKRQLD